MTFSYSNLRRQLCVLAWLALLAGCVAAPPADRRPLPPRDYPSEPQRRAPPPPPAREPVREPERSSRPSRQTPPQATTDYLANPAVAELVRRAESFEVQGNIPQASAQLDRALRIEPRNPELLQRQASLLLLLDRPLQAESFADKSYALGPKWGDLCRRNWQTMAAARAETGDRAGARSARERQSDC